MDGQLNIVSFLAKKLLYTAKVAQADNAGIPFKKVVEEAKFLSLPRVKVINCVWHHPGVIAKPSSGQMDRVN